MGGRRYVRGAGLGKGEGLHWFSILNSLGIIVLLTFLVATIILRTLHRDIALYNDRSMDDQAPHKSSDWYRNLARSEFPVSLLVT